MRSWVLVVLWACASLGSDKTEKKEEKSAVVTVVKAAMLADAAKTDGAALVDVILSKLNGVRRPLSAPTPGDLAYQEALGKRAGEVGTKFCLNPSKPAAHYTLQPTSKLHVNLANVGIIYRNTTEKVAKAIELWVGEGVNYDRAAVSCADNHNCLNYHQLVDDKVTMVGCAVTAYCLLPSAYVICVFSTD